MISLPRLPKSPTPTTIKPGYVATNPARQGAIVLYTSEDYVLKDKLSQAVHPATTKEYNTSDLDNLQRNILQFGTNMVCYLFSVKLLF